MERVLDAALEIADDVKACGCCGGDGGDYSLASTSDTDTGYICFECVCALMACC